MQAIYAALGMIIIAIGGFVAAKLNAWADAQIGKIKDEKVAEKVRLARDAIGDAVHHVSQTLAPELKAASADGKITPEERESLRQLALSKTKSSFNKQFWSDMANDLGVDELDEWILDRVEAEVFRMKPITSIIDRVAEEAKEKAAHG